jgi:hypothetical protein
MRPRQLLSHAVSSIPARKRGSSLRMDGEPDSFAVMQQDGGNPQQLSRYAISLAGKLRLFGSKLKWILDRWSVICKYAIVFPAAL